MLTLTVAGCLGACTGDSLVGPPQPTISVPRSPGVLSVVVPDAVGLSADNAQALIRSSGFEVSWSRPVDDSAAFTVVSQRPAAGATAGPGSAVWLEVSLAQGDGLPAPALITPSGLSLRIARLVCDQRGKQTSPYGWNADFEDSTHIVQGDGFFLQAPVSLTRPDGTVLDRTVDCLVGGDDIVPAVELFWVH